MTKHLMTWQFTCMMDDQKHENVLRGQEEEALGTACTAERDEHTVRRHKPQMCAALITHSALGVYLF